MSQQATDPLSTNRLRLVPATAPMIDAELESWDRLGEVLDAAVPRDWPPEHHEIQTLSFWRGKLSDPRAAGWWLQYVLLVDGIRPSLVGTVAYKGPPLDGIVEIGYSIVPSWQHRGLATEATRALIDGAWERGVEVVIAHTLPHLEPSLRVLHKLGFVQVQGRDPDAVTFALRRGDPEGTAARSQARPTPSGNLGWRGCQPSSRFALAFEVPRIWVIIDTPTSPAASRPSQTGTRSGGLAPVIRASSGSHSATGRGWSSTTLYVPGGPSMADTVAEAASSM